MLISSKCNSDGRHFQLMKFTNIVKQQIIRGLWPIKEDGSLQAGSISHSVRNGLFFNKYLEKVTNAYCQNFRISCPTLSLRFMRKLTFKNETTLAKADTHHYINYWRGRREPQSRVISDTFFVVISFP